MRAWQITEELLTGRAGIPPRILAETAAPDARNRRPKTAEEAEADRDTTSQFTAHHVLRSEGQWFQAWKRLERPNRCRTQSQRSPARTKLMSLRVPIHSASKAPAPHLHLHKDRRRIDPQPGIPSTIRALRSKFSPRGRSRNSMACNQQLPPFCAMEFITTSRRLRFRLRMLGFSA